MSNGEIAYLAMVLFAFATFISVVGFVSIWSRRPAQKVSMNAIIDADHEEQPARSWAALAEARVSLAEARSSRAA